MKALPKAALSFVVFVAMCWLSPTIRYALFPTIEYSTYSEWLKVELEADIPLCLGSVVIGGAFALWVGTRLEALVLAGAIVCPLLVFTTNLFGVTVHSGDLTLVILEKLEQYIGVFVAVPFGCLLGVLGAWAVRAWRSHLRRLSRQSGSNT